MKKKQLTTFFHLENKATAARTIIEDAYVWLATWVIVPILASILYAIITILRTFKVRI